MNNYLGYTKLSDEQMSIFYSENKLDFNPYQNEYIICGTDVYCYQNGQLRRVDYKTIKNSWTGEIKPRNIEQKAAFDMILDEQSTIKLITGTWGTGKTMILVTAALEAVNAGKFDKIVWVRNNVQTKDTDSMGALPGSELDKLLPYVMPMADHCGGVEGIDRLIEDGKLEVIPLAYLRGRSIRNSIIISSEAENLTKEHLQLIIGRVDTGSILMIDGDTRQRDKVAFEKSKGLEIMIDRLKGNKLFGYVHLVKSERSETAQLADLLND